MDPSATPTERRSEPPTNIEPIISLAPTPRHGPIIVRRWSKELAASASIAASNRAIWLNLRDGMPHPYTLADAEWWIAHCSSPENWSHVRTFDAHGAETAGEKRPSHFVIVAPNPDTGTDETIGSIGLVMGADVARRSADLGYWLAEAQWGRGIMGEIVERFIAWVWEAWPGVLRVHAEVYAANERSAGVLRKNGFEFEGRQRCAVWKDGKVLDTLAFACLRPGLIA